MQEEILRLAKASAEQEGMDVDQWIEQAIKLRSIVYICPACLEPGHQIISLIRSPDRVCWCGCHKFYNNKKKKKSRALAT